MCPAGEVAGTHGEGVARGRQAGQGGWKCESSIKAGAEKAAITLKDYSVF